MATKPGPSWLQDARSSGDLSDCTLKAAGDDTLFPVHRMVLRFQSPYFRVLLDPKSGFKESSSEDSPIEIGQVTSETLRSSLDLMYDKPAPLETVSLALEVAVFGNRIDVPKVAESAIRVACQKLALTDIHDDFLIAISTLRILESKSLQAALLLRLSSVPVFLSAVIENKDWVRELEKSEVGSVIENFLREAGTVALSGLPSGVKAKGAAFKFILLWAMPLNLEKEAPFIGPLPETSILDQIAVKVQPSPRLESGDVESLLELIDWRTVTMAELEFLRRCYSMCGVSSPCLQNIAMEMWSRERRACFEAQKNAKFSRESAERRYMRQRQESEKAHNESRRGLKRKHTSLVANLNEEHEKVRNLLSSERDDALAKLKEANEKAEKYDQNVKKTTARHTKAIRGKDDTIAMLNKRIRNLEEDYL